MENDVSIKTIKNNHGELIHVKKDNGKIFILHEDCTNDYISWENFIKEYVISKEEFQIICKTILELIDGK